MNFSLPCPPTTTAEERQRLERDFETYRRELPRLLAEGHAERYVLIKDAQVISLWDTQSDALQAGHLLFGEDRFAVNRLNPQDVRRLAWLEEQARLESRKTEA